MQFRSLAASGVLFLATSSLPISVSATCLQPDLFCSDKYVFTRPLLVKHMSCKELWELRNSILNEHGYCFSRNVEASEFNSDCSVDSYEKLDLNPFERDNIALIHDVERTKFCH